MFIVYEHPEQKSTYRLHGASSMVKLLAALVTQQKQCLPLGKYYPEQNIERLSVRSEATRGLGNKANAEAL